MALFGKKELQVIREGVWDKNPITFLVMGICSSLAVTSKVETAFLMSVGLTVVTAFSNMSISFIRNLIPSNIRIIIQLTIVATLVIIVDQLMKVYAYDVSRQMSIFVGLIITNCIVMGRLEGFAMSNPPWRSFLDGAANGIGYSMVLLSVAAVREVFGSGKFLGYSVIPQAFYDAGYANNSIMVLAPGAFFLLAAFIGVQRMISGYVEDK